MLRWLTAGESHGPSLVAILEGLPAHVRVTSDDLADALARRRLGYGRGARMKFEADEVRILGGVRHGETLGGPVAIEVGNTEWPKWEKVMSADPVDPVELEALARNAALTRPRPGHADLVGHAEVRLRRGPPDPRARLRPRDRGPGRAGPGRRQLPRAGGRRPGGLPRRRARRRAARRTALVPGPRRRRAARRRPGALPRPRGQRGDGRRDRPGPQGRRHPRRRRRGRRVTACRRASARTCTGTAGSTPGSPAR